MSIQRMIHALLLLTLCRVTNAIDVCIDYYDSQNSACYRDDDRKPWSELSNNQEIFKAVRDEKRTLPSLEKDGEDVPDGYDDLMKRCCKYKANQRPLIDVVRDNLQKLLERAAEIDREKTVHRELTRGGSLSRSRMLLEMTRGNEDEETKSSDSSKQRSSETNRSSTDSSLQGYDDIASVQIEMGMLSSSNSSF